MDLAGSNGAEIGDSEGRGAREGYVYSGHTGIEYVRRTRSAGASMDAAGHLAHSVALGV